MGSWTQLKKEIVNHSDIIVLSISTSCASGSNKRPKSIVEDIEDDVSPDNYIKHKNQPILMGVYRHPDTEKDKVIIVANLLSGTTDVIFASRWWSRNYFSSNKLQMGPFLFQY